MLHGVGVGIGVNVNVGGGLGRAPVRILLSGVRPPVHPPDGPQCLADYLGALLSHVCLRNQFTHLRSVVRVEAAAAAVAETETERAKLTMHSQPYSSQSSDSPTIG